jgi:DNA-directed RNA polymerase specialized sigma24 family protein
LGFAIPIDDLVAVDAILTSMGEESPRLVRVVELRFFAGLSEDETARTLDVSTRTVQRDWAKARTRLHHGLDRANGSS